MPTVLKLTQVGQSVTMLVQSCTLATQGKYPGYVFTGQVSEDEWASVEVPKSSTERQLPRIDLTPETCVGHTLTIGRDENRSDASKPYWGIYKVGGAVNNKPVSTSVPMPKPGPVSAALKAEPNAEHARVERKEQAAHVVKSYLALYDRVAEHIVSLSNSGTEGEGGMGFTVDASGINAATASIFIALDKRGLI